MTAEPFGLTLPDSPPTAFAEERYSVEVAFGEAGFVLAVGLPTNRVVCVDCGTQLAEGRAVTVSAYRTAEAVDWDLRRCYCEACAPTGIATPTLGVSELLVQAWLGSLALPRTRTHRLCLTEIDVVAASPPAEGAQP